MLLSNTVYPLYWEKNDFKTWYNSNHNLKIMFQLKYMELSDYGQLPTLKHLSMDGWLASEEDYLDYDPSIHLQVCTEETNANDQLNLENNNPIYFGNLKLRAAIVKKIYKTFFPDSAPQPNYKFIIFKPLLDDNNHLYFEIYLCPIKPDATKELANYGLKVTKADPSPPATSK